MKKLLKAIWNNLKKDKNWILTAIPVILIYVAGCMFILKSFCPLVAFTGFPCPGCGGIRTMKLCLTGHFADAWNMNPCFFLWVGLAIYAFFCRYVKGQRIKGITPILIVIGVTMLIMYAVRMSLYFPDRAPYVFQSDNILNHILPGYSEQVERLIYSLHD